MRKAKIKPEDLNVAEAEAAAAAAAAQEGQGGNEGGEGNFEEGQEGDNNPNEDHQEDQEDLGNDAPEQTEDGSDDSEGGEEPVDYETWLKRVDEVAGEGFAAAHGAGSNGNDQLRDLYDNGTSPQVAFEHLTAKE